MTTSVLELVPTGGSTGWDVLCTGYDASPPLVFTVGYEQNVNFSLSDAAVAGVIDKITIAHKSEGSSSPGVNQTVRGRMLVDGTYYETADVSQKNSNAWVYIDVAVNPKTSSAWLWPEIDALEAGIEVDVTFGGWLKLYQFKVQVTYTPEAYTPPMLIKGSPAIGCGSMIF